METSASCEARYAPLLYPTNHLPSRSTRFYAVLASYDRACAQLLLVEFAAGPALRNGEHGERDWIPVGPEGWALVPRHHGTHNTHGKTQDAKHQSVQHGPIGREPRRDVASRDAVDRAINGCEEQRRVGHRLAPWRENAGCVQHHIGDD